jgi:hypothetical protein
MLSEFKKAGAYIDPLSDERKSFIESVQPYNAPNLLPNDIVWNLNRSLGILNDWARKDRHRKLHMMMSWAANISPKLAIPPGVGLVYLVPSGAGFLENKSDIAIFKLSGWLPGMEVNANPNLTVDVALNEEPPCCTESDTLSNRVDAIFRSVKSVVRTLERS